MPQTILTSPKITKSSSGTLQRWYKYYAMFSDQFASEVIRLAELPPGSVVLDPWLGVGTTAVAAASLGHYVYGSDINPAMTAISKGRFADRNRLKGVCQRIATKLSTNTLIASIEDDDPLLVWFDDAAAATFRMWQQIIMNERNPDTMSPERCCILTSVFETACELSAGLKCRNPTWRRPPENGERPSYSREHITTSIFENIEKRASRLHPLHPSLMKSISTATSTKLPSKNSSVDFVLTSPPYCTRIDYAVSTSVEQAVLGFSDHSSRTLRDNSMGTTTIRRESISQRAEWGAYCNLVLDCIKSHPSKSSMNYYQKVFVQYFSDLHLSFQEINRTLRSGGNAIIVVQDSYYKEIHVDLARIAIDLASDLKWQLTARYDYPVRQNMRHLNTRSRKYRDTAPTSETVLWFKKSTAH